jgi:tellurite resistance protein
MDDDAFNMNIRKFLKQVGVTSQREIEAAVQAAIADGRISGDESLSAKVTLEIAEVGLSHEIDGKIGLS